MKLVLWILAQTSPRSLNGIRFRKRYKKPTRRTNEAAACDATSFEETALAERRNMVFPQPIGKILFFISDDNGSQNGQICVRSTHASTSLSATAPPVSDGLPDSFSAAAISPDEIGAPSSDLPCTSAMTLSFNTPKTPPSSSYLF